MKILLLTIAILLSCIPTLALAATPGGTASVYSIQTDTLDAGGGKSSNGVYSQVASSIGQTIVDTSAMSPDSAQHGFVGQLFGFPTITTISNQTIQQGSALSAFAFTIGDTDTSAATLYTSLTCTFTNNSLLPVNTTPAVVFGGSGANPTLTLTPLSTQYGSITVTIAVTDTVNQKARTSFVLTVNPTLMLVTNAGQTCQTANHADVLPTLLLVSNAADPSPGNPTDTAASNKFKYTLSAVPAHGQLKLSGGTLGTSGMFTQDDVNNGRVTYFNDGSAFSSDGFTFTVSDGSGGAIGSTTFNITISTSGSQSPILSNLTSPAAINESIPGNLTSTSLTYTISDPANTADKLTVTPSSSNTTLIPNDLVNNLIVTGSQSGASANLGLTIKPALNHHGTAVVTIQVKNPINLTAPPPNTANVIVNFVNQVSVVANQSINVNSSSAAIPVTVGDLDPLPGGVTLSATSDNPAVISNANIVLSGALPNQTITLVAGNTPGTANITLTASGGGAANATRTFAVSVTAVKSLVVMNTTDAAPNSLRDCITRAQKGDTITFDPTVFNPVNADAATTINLLSPLPNISQGNLTIDASNQRATVNGAAAAAANGLTIVSSGNTVLGLNLVQFTRSGISIQGGAANNTIGGNRNSGSGPNGQGLRLAANGSDGIDITDPGTNANLIEGCWIGLASDGVTTQGNLAGIVIENGASQNIIGSTTAGQGNIISGNSQEGITVAGAGSDANIIMGNIVGLTNPPGSRDLASSRDNFLGNRSAGNGDAGIFISQATQHTLVGGTDSAGASANTIGFNIGNGIDIHDPACMRISARGNKISANKKKGISLATGSNNNVQPPVISEVLGASIDSGAGRAVNTVTVAGSAPGDGTVEVFNDPDTQGATLLGRSSVSNQKWSLVSVPADDTQKITATYTDLNGNTSEFSSPDSAAPNNPRTSIGDADGDGFPDAFEVAIGSNPLDPTSTPLGGASVGTTLPLTLGATSVKLNFNNKGADQITVSGKVNVPKGYTSTGQTAAVFFGGTLAKYTLAAKGTTKGGASSFKLAGVKFGKDGTASAAVTATFTAKFPKSNYSAALAYLGFANTKSASISVMVPTLVLFNAQLYGGTKSLTFVVKQGKSGTATAK